MKFGKYLRAQEVPGWEFYYLSYNRIKKQLVKEATTTTEVAQVQKNFQIALEKELEKINSFYQLKADQLYDNVLQAKQQIKEGQTSTEIDEELDRISSELIHLERFQKLNLMGFSKLLKKHDKHSQVEAKAWFMLRVEDQPFVKKDLDHILVQLSESWKLLKIARNKKTIEERKGEQNQPTAQVFERKTTKYWVPEDKMLEVKTMVIKHLPIDIFDKSVTRSDNLTTSVYYDSEDLELYHDRLQRNEGAVNLRMRTYGKGTTQPTVFVERKTHHDTWVGESSVKERFTIKRNKLYDFLHGRYNLDEKLKKAKNRKEMSDKEIEDTRRLSKEVQQLVMEHQLQPTVITRYTRTAFQMGRDASVRMSLDGDLHMIKEHGYIGNRWGRDLSEPVDEDDIVWFPYGILEVKLALTVGQETPEWITELLEKNKLIMVPKFSKFIHGCVTLFPEKVQLLPPWLPLLKAREITIEDKLYEFRTQTDTLVRKSIKEKEEKIPEKKPTQPQKIEIVTVPSTQKSPSVPSASAADRRVVERVPNDIEMESASLLGKPKKSLRDSSSKYYDSDDEKAKAPSPWQRVSSWFKSKFHKEEKKAQMPIKVDPKTFFANERTLLHWLSFLIVVQSIGIALMRFSTGYEPWRIGGIIFVGISLIFMGYSVLRYEQRRNAITKKIKGPYSDRFGPIILVTALLAAVIVNVVLVYKVYFANACAGASLLDLSFSKYEPNDILYHPVKGLVAVQSNTITYIDVDDKVTYDNWLPGQHSSVTFTDSAIPLLYIGQLYPPAIVEFNMESNSVQRVFPLKSFPGANSTNGVNALTYVPVSGHPEGGQFWVGSNADGGIYVYDIPIRTNTSSTVAQLASQMFPAPGDNQLNSLSYHPESNTVYTVYKNWLLNLNPSTGVAKANTLLGYPEVNGIAVKGEGKSMEIFVACIVCNDIYKFPFGDGKTIKSGPCYPAVTSTSSASFLK